MLPTSELNPLGPNDLDTVQIIECAYCARTWLPSEIRWREICPECRAEHIKDSGPSDRHQRFSLDHGRERNGMGYGELLSRVSGALDRPVVDLGQLTSSECEAMIRLYA